VKNDNIYLKILLKSRHPI